MTKQERQDRARQLHADHNNCCQSVVVCYADEIGLDEATAARITTSFGRGIAGMGEVCGCVAGMAMVAGAAGYGDEVRTLCERFRAEYGDVACARLLKNCRVPCREKIAFAAGLLSDVLDTDKQ